MRFETAIEHLVDNYRYAKSKVWIRDKVAWALYHTWKEADRKTEPTGYNLSPVEDESQTADVCTWDGKVGEIEIHNILYEPTYNEDDGSM